MKHSILVPIALLRAACIASKDEDTWDTRNLDSVAIKNGHIVATDGRILFYAKLEKVPDNIFFIIPKAYAESFIKKTAFSSGLKHCQISYDTESQTGLIEIPHHYNAYEAFKVFLKVTYPDWEKVIPANTDYEGFVRFGSEYLLKVEEICSELGSICNPVITPTGMNKGANIDFLYSDFNDVKAVLMPRSNDPDSGLYSVVVGPHPEDDEDVVQMAAASAELAFKAAHRLRKSFIFNPRFENDHSEFNDGANWIYPAIWNGTKKAHAEELKITEEWFSKPLKRYDNAEMAIKYIKALNDCVECYVDDKSVIAQSEEDVLKFFSENQNPKLWAVNIPEEPDSASILHPVPSHEIAKIIATRLKKEALQQFPNVGKSIADAVTIEEWQGTSEEHAEYLKSNPIWWLHTTFLEQNND